MTPQDKLALTRFSMMAKHIIYDTQRFKHFLNLLGSQAGAIHAVHLVLAIIEKTKPIPLSIVHQLGVNAYLLMVEVAEKVTGHQADPGIVHSVIQTLAGTIDKTHPAPATMPPKGIIGSQMGAAA
jgi:hypothetical protein